VLTVTDDVREVLLESQRLGFLGERGIDEVIDHARAFVIALEEVSGTIVDLGAGGGIPGLVIAHDRPDLHLTMVDRRSKRTDFLERVVRRLRWAQRVTVIDADVEALISGDTPRFNAAVARGFGPPAATLEIGSKLVMRGGCVIISEPPSGDRWESHQLIELALRRVDTSDDRVACFRRE
jgi:16S rRNA (guanine527-N7)-methyltransferase